MIKITNTSESYQLLLFLTLVSFINQSNSKTIVDLTKHFVILTKFKGIMELENIKDEENKFLSLSIALKCAGIYY